jgi:hypothetical protein
MAKKVHPERVIREIVRMAMKTGKDRAALFSEYIRIHYQATGRLAPGCDAQDFYAVLDEMARFEQGSEVISDQ